MVRGFLRGRRQYFTQRRVRTGELAGDVSGQQLRHRIVALGSIFVASGGQIGSAVAGRQRCGFAIEADDL
jgi:hypothetical protein